MRQGAVNPLLAYVRSINTACTARELSDEELLQRYLDDRDESAFAALVRRHGPLVFGVCRRLLPHEADAEDAFQATFFVLARQARSIRRRGSLSSFLHGVAERIARQARRKQARRRECLMPVPECSTSDAVASLVWSDLRWVLDEEIGRLPEPYREAFILCHLEGHSNAEAARRLGCPRGTVLSRLARARERLAKRLRGRGITLSAAALTTALSAKALRAAVSPPLAYSVIRLGGLLAAQGSLAAGMVSANVLALASQGGKMMLWTKAITLLTMVLTGTALTATVLAERRPVPAGESPAPKSADVSVAPKKAEPDKPRPERKEQTPLEKAIAAAAGIAPPHRVEKMKEKKEEKKEETPVEKVLRQWDEADAKIHSMRVRFTRIDKDPVFFETGCVTKGHAARKKPDLWRINRFDKDGQMQELFLVQANKFHWFNREEKTETIFPVPEREPPDPGNGLIVPETFMGISLKHWDEPILWLAFGPQARDLKKRFEIRLVKEDQSYSYLDITPRGGKEWFQRGRIVLERRTWQVRQLWLQYPSRNETLVDFLDRATNPELSPQYFTQDLPQGWKRREWKDGEKGQP